MDRQISGMVPNVVSKSKMGTPLAIYYVSVDVDALYRREKSSRQTPKVSFTNGQTPLSTLLGIEALLNPLFKKSKEPLHVCERGFGIVIVIHQSVLVMVALCQILVNNETRLLHCRTSVLELL